MWLVIAQTSTGREVALVAKESQRLALQNAETVEKLMGMEVGFLAYIKAVVPVDEKTWFYLR